jgi:hypothetical protein
VDTWTYSTIDGTDHLQVSTDGTGEVDTTAGWMLGLQVTATSRVTAVAQATSTNTRAAPLHTRLTLKIIPGVRQVGALVVTTRLALPQVWCYQGAGVC